MAFPTGIYPIEPLEEKILTSDLVTQTEAFYKRARKKNTRQLYQFKLKFEKLSETDYNSILTHFSTVTYVGTFSWINPISSIVYTVRYGLQSFIAQRMAVGNGNINFVLEEV